jgi:hypothetical protein
MDGSVDEIVVSAEVLAKFFDCTPRRVWQFATEGMPKNERGEYPLIACVVWFIRKLKGKRSNIVNIDEARQRKINAEASLAELALAKEENSTISISDHGEVIGGLGDVIRGRLLVLPSKLAPALALETKQGLCKQIIEDEIRSTLAEIARIVSDDGSRKPKGKGGASKASKAVSSAA